MTNSEALHSEIPHKGSCLCNSIQFETDLIESNISHCHCTMCRKFHGAEFATYGESLKEKFRWIRGEEYIRSYLANNGTKRQFCKLCGSSLTFIPAANPRNMIEIALGVLDTELHLRPEAHVFTNFKASWSAIHDKLPQFTEGRNSEINPGCNDDKANLSSIISQRVESGNWKEIESFFNRTEFAEHFGITVLLDNPDAPQCEVLEVKPFHLGGLGQAFINGAIVSAMFDLSIGLTALKYTAKGTFGTSNVNINFVKPIENNRFYSIAKCNTKIGNRVFSEATLFNYKDEPCAYATGEIRIGIK